LRRNFLADEVADQGANFIGLVLQDEAAGWRLNKTLSSASTFFIARFTLSTPRDDGSSSAGFMVL
jgi:hypothetical protein